MTSKLSAQEFNILLLRKLLLVVGATIAVISASCVPRSAHAAEPISFTMPFPFRAATLNLPSGTYEAIRVDDGRLTLRAADSRKEFSIPVIATSSERPTSGDEPQLVFDVVGNFAPSYTEYLTEYVLAQVWWRKSDGSIVHVTKGGHSTKIISSR